MGDETKKPRWGIAPFFAVADVVATANYYRDQLGFHYERFWNEPPSFCMVKRNGIVIMLAQLEAPGAVRPNRRVDPEGNAWDAYVWIDDADALYAEFQSKGVKIARDLQPVLRLPRLRRGRLQRLPPGFRPGPRRV